MIYFKSIQPTRHYLEEHLKDVRWDKVIEIILLTKNPKKISDKFIITKNGYYVLFKIKNDIIYVINAKYAK
mgnify:CR=1 FL=1|jgi:hypothetical protein